MTTNIVRPGAIGNLPIYLYLNFDARFIKANKFFLPDWLKAKTVENFVSKSHQKGSVPDLQLFEGKVVDVLTLLEDFARDGRQPSHIHMMNREHRGVRVRVTFCKGGDVLPGVEIDWVVNAVGRFYWDAKSYKRTEASEHLPPHVNVHLGNPVERDEATSVFSVQIMDDEPSLINDPA